MIAVIARTLQDRTTQTYHRGSHIQTLSRAHSAQLYARLVLHACMYTFTLDAPTSIVAAAERVCSGRRLTDAKLTPPENQNVLVRRGCRAWLIFASSPLSFMVPTLLSGRCGGSVALGVALVGLPPPRSQESSMVSPKQVIMRVRMYL